MPRRPDSKGAINPDIDSLASVELIEQGEVIQAASSQNGAPEIELHHELQATHGTWFVLRALGQNADTLALSAPIYVVVDGQSFWKPQAVPSIVANLKHRMQELVVSNHLEEIETWETRELDARYRDAQRAALRERIDQASALYDDLARRAAAAMDRSWRLATRTPCVEVSPHECCGSVEAASR